VSKAKKQRRTRKKSYIHRRRYIDVQVNKQKQPISHDAGQNAALWHECLAIERPMIKLLKAVDAWHQRCATASLTPRTDDCAKNFSSATEPTFLIGNR
jgi:hypothetical protein